MCFREGMQVIYAGADVQLPPGGLKAIASRSCCHFLSGPGGAADGSVLSIYFSIGIRV